MVIDIHVHIGRGEKLTDTYQVDCSLEKILANMAESGVDKTCINPVTYGDYEVPLRDEVLAAVTAYPDRLIGFARVNLNDEQRAFQQLRRSFEEYEFRGLKIHHGLGDGFPTRRLMEFLSDYGYPLIMHTTPSIEVIDSIAYLAQTYPKVPVICGHMGAYGVTLPGFVKLCATEARRIPNLYLDTAFVFLYQWIGMAVEICGPEKVLFGTDSPSTHPALPLKQIELCHFSDSERALILGKNAKRLLKL